MIRKIALILASLATTVVLAPSEPAGAAFSETRLCVEATDAAKRWGVRHSIREWNSVPVGPRLILRDHCPRGSRLKPFVKIRTGREQGTHTGRHYNLGPGAHEIVLNRRATLRHYRSVRCVRAFTVTHELGHALGLDHFPRRSNMAMGYDNWWNICGDITRADRRYKVRFFRSH